MGNKFQKGANSFPFRERSVTGTPGAPARATPTLRSGHLTLSLLLWSCLLGRVFLLTCGLAPPSVNTMLPAVVVGLCALFRIDRFNPLPVLR